jgi:hypothetical protein
MGCGKEVHAQTWVYSDVDYSIPLELYDSEDSLWSQQILLVVGSESNCNIFEDKLRSLSLFRPEGVTPHVRVKWCPRRSMYVVVAMRSFAANTALYFHFDTSNECPGNRGDKLTTVPSFIAGAGLGVSATSYIRRGETVTSIQLQKGGGRGCVGMDLSRRTVFTVDTSNGRDRAAAISDASAGRQIGEFIDECVVGSGIVDSVEFGPITRHENGDFQVQVIATRDIAPGRPVLIESYAPHFADASTPTCDYRPPQQFYTLTTRPACTTMFQVCCCVPFAEVLSLLMRDEKSYCVDADSLRKLGEKFYSVELPGSHFQADAASVDSGILYGAKTSECVLVDEGSFHYTRAEFCGSLHVMSRTMRCPLYEIALDMRSVIPEDDSSVGTRSGSLKRVRCRTPPL